MTNTWESLVEEAADILSKTEHLGIYDNLGRIASLAVETYGPKCLPELSANIRDTCGLSRSPMTLANYAWVYNKTKDLELPPDISYKAKQHIAGSGRPNYWAHKVLTEGLNDIDVITMIRKEKGILNKEKKKKQVICPRCGYEYLK